MLSTNWVPASGSAPAWCDWAQASGPDRCHHMQENARVLAGKLQDIGRFE